MKKKILVLILLLLVLSVILMLPGLSKAADATEFGNVTTLGDYLSAVMTWLVTILGSLATLMMIYAGYLYMTSQGNPEATGRAKDIIVGVITGIILLFLVEVIAVNTLGLQFTFSVTPVSNSKTTP